MSSDLLKYFLRLGGIILIIVLVVVFGVSRACKAEIRSISQPQSLEVPHVS